MARCQDCGEHSPEQASFCIVCGARLIAPGTRTRAPLAPSVGPTIRLSPTGKVAQPSASRPPARPNGKAAQPNGWRVLIPVVGLAFGMAVVIGIAQLMALHGLRAATLMSLAVLIGGVLLAESAWVNGQLWRGLRGMLLWGGLIGLIAFGRLMPWALALALGWLALHPGWYNRHS
ncbi:MAG TPA: hypothetical protein VFU22_14645 [Roseiflexaceae bacterium]|nr:hypothetical protein [Roseiflexaceae bacterium]